MRINLRRADGTVSKHPLNVADIDVLLQQKRGKRMPEHMRRDVLRDARKLRIMIDHKTDRLIGKLML